jgi:hypothetical protein
MSRRCLDAWMSCLLRAKHLTEHLSNESALVGGSDLGSRLESHTCNSRKRAEARLVAKICDDDRVTWCAAYRASPQTTGSHREWHLSCPNQIQVNFSSFIKVAQDAVYAVYAVYALAGLFA